MIPLAVGLVGRDGRDLPLTLAGGGPLARGVLMLDKPSEVFEFADVGEAPVASLNRGFSAPIKLTANLSADDLRFLAARDSDPFNRWQALQTLATRLLVDNVAAARTGAAARRDGGLLDALAAILADGTLDPAFVALVLTMPGEADIAREIGRDVDPDAIFAARTALRAASASISRPRCSITIAGFRSPAPTGPMPRARRGARCATPASISWSPRGGPTRSRSRPHNIRPPTT